MVIIKQKSIIIINIYSRTNTDNGRLPLVVIGDPGTGKSSLVAAFAYKYMKNYPHRVTIVHISF